MQFFVAVLLMAFIAALIPVHIRELSYHHATGERDISFPMLASVAFAALSVLPAYLVCIFSYEAYTGLMFPSDMLLLGGLRSLVLSLAAAGFLSFVGGMTYFKEGYSAGRKRRWAAAARSITVGLGLLAFTLAACGTVIYAFVTHLSYYYPYAPFLLQLLPLILMAISVLWCGLVCAAVRLMYYIAARQITLMLRLSSRLSSVSEAVSGSDSTVNELGETLDEVNETLDEVNRLVRKRLWSSRSSLPVRRRRRR